MPENSNNKPVDPIALFNQLSNDSSISTDDFYSDAPKLRHSFQARGKILLLPKSDLVVVPFNEHRGGWDAAIVRGSEVYPVGGHHIFVTDVEIESALEYELGALLPSTPRKESDPNSIFSRILREREQSGE